MSNVENLLTLGIVALAVSYLLRRAWTTFFGKQPGGCGACATCPSQAKANEPQVIGIDSLFDAASRPRP